VDDTKCYLNLNSLSDNSILQENLNAIILWSQKWHLTFNKNVFVHFKPILQTSYDIRITQLVAQQQQCHKDLSILFLPDLQFT